MNALTLPVSRRDSRIPRSERILRLLRESGHLRALIASYHCEPRTEKQFSQRNSLRERLRAFESKCRQDDKRPLPHLLLEEFNHLQHDTFTYIREARV